MDVATIPAKIHLEKSGKIKKKANQKYLTKIDIDSLIIIYFCRILRYAVIASSPKLCYK